MFMKISDFARLLASVTALTLAAPALAQDNSSVSDFELPSEQETPRAQPQGPVVEGIAPPRVARPAPTPTPAPPPVAIDTSPVAVDPGASLPSPTAGESVRTAIDGFNAARPQATPGSDAATEATAATGATALPSTTASQPSLSLPQPAATQPAASAPTPAVVHSGGLAWWMWVLALLAVGTIGILAGWLWRGRRAEARFEVEEIERPHPSEPISPPAELPKVAARKPPEAPPMRQPEPVPAPAMADDHDDHLPERPLRIALEPARLSVSLLNATLSYRILLTNQGDAPLRDISIDGDMISAHASLSQEEQIAASNSKLENRHLIRTLFPGETKVVSGDFALPLPHIRPIRNGDAALFVPLARLRVVSVGEQTEVIVQTSVVGQRSARPGGGLQPFRLDLGPRIYSELGQRAFA